MTLARALRAQVGEGAVVVVLEDLHWADAATLDVVRLIAAWVEQAPVVLIGTYRDDELEAHRELALLMGDLVTHPAALRLQPATLSIGAVRELAEPSSLDPDELLRLTGGNPLLVVESIAARGGVPATVRDATLARTRRLGADARGALDAAAVIGQDVPLELLRTVASASTEALDECTAHGVLVGTGTTLAFRHELIRRAVEQSISPARRSELHARVVAALLERGGQAATRASLTTPSRPALATWSTAMRSRRPATPSATGRAPTPSASTSARCPTASPRRASAPSCRSRSAGPPGSRAARARRCRRSARPSPRPSGSATGRSRPGRSARSAARCGRSTGWPSRGGRRSRRWPSSEEAGDPAALAHALSGLVSMLAVGVDPAGALAAGPRALAEATRAGLGGERLDVELSLALARGIHGEADAAPRLARCLEQALRNRP